MTTLFTPIELNAACAAAVAAAAAKSLAEGEDAAATEARRCESLGTVFRLAEGPFRKGPNGTNYRDLTATVPGKTGRLVIRALGEKNVGQIAPLDDADVAEVNAARGDKYGLVKKRDRDPSFSVQRYDKQVATDDANCPTEPLPGPEHESALFKTLEYLDDFFSHEMRRLKRAGLITLAGDRDAVVAPGGVAVANTKVTATYQRTISLNAPRNAGKDLVNPIARIKIKFDKDTQLSKCQFFDITKPFTTAAGATSYEPLLVDGEPVTGHNVHKALPSGARCMVLINANAMCASNMGLSIPMTVTIICVEPPAVTQVGLEDLLGDMGMGGAAPVPAAAPAATPAAPAATPAAAVAQAAAAATVQPVTDAALDDIVGDLAMA